MRLGTGELLLIFAIALLVFGPSRLPELAKTLGKSINVFKKEANKATEELKNAVKDDMDNEDKEQE